MAGAIFLFCFLELSVLFFSLSVFPCPLKIIEKEKRPRCCKVRTKGWRATNYYSNHLIYFFVQQIVGRATYDILGAGLS